MKSKGEGEGRKEKVWTRMTGVILIKMSAERCPDFRPSPFAFRLSFIYW